MGHCHSTILGRDNKLLQAIRDLVGCHRVAVVVFPIQMGKAVFRRADRAREELDRCNSILTCSATDADVDIWLSVEHPLADVSAMASKVIMQ